METRYNITKITADYVTVCSLSHMHNVLLQHEKSESVLYLLFLCGLIHSQYPCFYIPKYSMNRLISIFVLSFSPCKENSPFTMFYYKTCLKIEVNTFIITNLYNCLGDQSYKMSLHVINLFIFNLPLVYVRHPLNFIYLFIWQTTREFIAV